MTDSLFFDSDCISAFLWVGNENLLVKLYPGRIVIPKTVYDELSYPGIAHLKARVDALLSVGQAQVMSIDVATEAYDIYYQLTEKPKAGHIFWSHSLRQTIFCYCSRKMKMMDQYERFSKNTQTYRLKKCI